MQSQIKVACLSALLLLAPLCTAAFEKSDIGASDAKPTEPPANSSNRKNLSELSASAAVDPAQSEADGTAISIPGLGTVGIIPKLDFGMELLYGSENKHDEASPDSDDDDIQIRGTIRHRF